MEEPKDRKRTLREKLSALQEQRGECNALLEALEQSSTGQLSQSDADSRFLKKSGEQVVGYNAQLAVDAQHHLIVVQEVPQEPGDKSLLAPMALEARQALGVERLSAVADAGYYSHQQVRQCAEHGIEATAPNRQKPVAGEGSYPLESFRYDGGKDCYICPQGRELRRHEDAHNHGEAYRTYYDTAACANCPVQARCTRGKYRKLSVLEDQEFLDRVQRRWREEVHLRKTRTQSVEHPFGTMKFWWGFGSFLCRGLEMVRAEFSLTALAYNFRRALSVIGLQALLKALRA